jgi:hypothetical protein
LRVGHGRDATDGMPSVSAAVSYSYTHATDGMPSVSAAVSYSYTHATDGMPSFSAARHPLLDSPLPPQPI